MPEKASTIFKKQPSRLLFFDDGEVAILHTENHKKTLILQRYGNRSIAISGTIATALHQQLTGTDTVVSRTRLQHFARHNPALAGIECATTNSTAYQQLICNNLGLLFIELTLRCNERCLHCYAGSDPERSESLTCDEVKRVLDEARTMGAPRVQFTGGDPLIHPDLVELVGYAYTLKFSSIEIYTNGLSLHQKLLKSLEPFAPNFAFSLYSHCPQHHDAITQVAGSHARTVKAIQRVITMQLPLRVSMIIMDENSQDREATYQLLIDLGVPADHIGNDHVRAIGRGSSHAAGNQQCNIRPSPPRAGKLCISGDGHIYPCIFSRNVELGSIRNGTIRKQLTAITISSQPSSFNHCQQRLTCSDCQLSAFLLEKQS